VTTNSDCRVLVTGIAVRGFFHNYNTQNITENAFYSIRVTTIKVLIVLLKYSIFYAKSKQPEAEPCNYTFMVMNIQYFIINTRFLRKILAGIIRQSLNDSRFVFCAG
jgi:hypothetical protein